MSNTSEVYSAENLADKLFKNMTKKPTKIKLSLYMSEETLELLEAVKDIANDFVTVKKLSRSDVLEKFIYHYLYESNSYQIKKIYQHSPVLNTQKRTTGCNLPSSVLGLLDNAVSISGPQANRSEFAEKLIHFAASTSRSY